MLRYVTFGEMETGSHICQLLHIKRSKCVENQNWWRHFKQKNAWAWQLESGCVFSEEHSTNGPSQPSHGM